MPKSRKRKPKKKPSTNARSASGRDSMFERWDFRVRLPDAPDEVLATITPLTPDLTLERGELAHSPASTYLGLLRDEASRETADVIARWPFRNARAGEKAGSWLCLALLAYEQGLTVEEAAKSTVELEDSRLLTWSSEHNVYVMSPDMPTDHRSEVGMTAVDAMFDRINAESASERAQRRWAQPTVVAVPVDDDDDQHREETSQP